MTELLVNVDVEDLERGVRFYTGAFGLRVGRAAVELLGAADPICLLARATGTPPFAGAADGHDFRRHWTPMHLDFAVAELDAALERVVAAGATREGGIETHARGRVAHLADPFGNGFCLLQFLRLGYDQIAAP